MAALEDLAEGRALTFNLEPRVRLHLRADPAAIEQFQAHVRRSLLHLLPAGDTKH